MADLAGHPDPDKEQEPVKDRAFVEINRDSVRQRIMNAMGPRLAIRVDNHARRKTARSSGSN